MFGNQTLRELILNLNSPCSHTHNFRLIIMLLSLLMCKKKNDCEHVCYINWSYVAADNSFLSPPSGQTVSYCRFNFSFLQSLQELLEVQVEEQTVKPCINLCYILHNIPTLLQAAQPLVFLFPLHLARPGDELKVEQGVKDLRSLSLPNMKPSGSQSPYIVTPVSERMEHGSLGRRESIDLLVSIEVEVAAVAFTVVISDVTLQLITYETASQTHQTKIHRPLKPHTADRHTLWLFVFCYTLCYFP